MFRYLKATIIFSKSVFLPAITEWNNLDPNLRNSDTYGTFKNIMLKFP